LPNYLQKYYEKALITLPRSLSYLDDKYNINFSDLIILIIVNSANRQGNKITNKDIHKATGYVKAYIHNKLHKLKAQGYITLDYDYQLTNDGKVIIKSYARLIPDLVNDIKSDNVITFTDYSTKHTRKLAKEYKIKKGIK